MSRTIAHSPAALADGPRRTPRRPRYSDQRAAERRDVARTIADALSPLELMPSGSVELRGRLQRTIADTFLD